MIRIESINLVDSGLNAYEQAFVLNICMAVSCIEAISEAADILKAKVNINATDIYVYKGGHHISIGKTGLEGTPFLKLINIKDVYLAMNGFPEYLRNERAALGLRLDGCGT